MVLLFYAFLNTVCTWMFFKYCSNKRLHVLEISTYWLFATMLIQNYSALNHINFKLFVIVDVFHLEMAHFLNRIVLEPLVVVWFLHQFVAMTSFLKKAGCLTVYMILLVVQERLQERLGVIQNNGWKIWWSFLVWLTILLLTIGFMKVFRSKLKKVDG